MVALGDQAGRWKSCKLRGNTVVRKPFDGRGTDGGKTLASQRDFTGVLPVPAARWWWELGKDEQTPIGLNLA